MTLHRALCIVWCLAVCSSAWRTPGRLHGPTILNKHDAVTLREVERQRFISTAAVGGLLLLVPATARAKESKLDFDQRSVEVRPSLSDAAAPVFNGVRPNYQAVRSDIKEMIQAKPDKGPTLVRLAWHSSGTYDKMTKSGGSQLGTIRFKEELSHGANAGLDMAVAWLEPIFKKYNKNADLSYADLYTLAGIVGTLSKSIATRRVCVC